MSEITPAYRPFESRCNPSAPDEAFTTAYPLRSSAARRNAITDGSSSMSRIGPPVHNARCAFIAPLLSWQRPPVLPPSPRESAPQRCSPLPPHYSSTEFLRHAPAQRRRQRLFKIFHHLNPVARKIITPQLNRLPQNAVYLHKFPLHRSLPRETQQILHDIFRSLRFLQDDLQILPRRTRHLRILQQQIRETKNRRQRVIHFMRDPGNQPPNRRHLFAMRQLCLQQRRVCDVRHHHHDAVHRILLVSHRAQADRKVSHRSVASPHA